MEEISNSDIQKVKLITVSAQVDGLITLLLRIDKEALTSAVQIATLEQKSDIGYKLLENALAFYESIDALVEKTQENNDTEQATFNY